MAVPIRRLAVPLAALITVKVLGLRWMAHWGATTAELRAALPGDERIENSDLTTTRAVTVRTRAIDVWPWIAQLGQGRGGFYSYDALENLIGCDIHSADHIVPAWQDITVGAQVRLAPQVAMTVAALEPGRVLVLHGGVPTGPSAAPFDATWAFVLDEEPDGTTRLITRERYRYLRWWAPFMVIPMSWVSFVMSRKMLHGIAARAERPPGHDINDEERRMTPSVTTTGAGFARSGA